MPRIFLEVAAAVALTLAAIIASATGVNASDVMVTGAYARASATPAAKAGAAYLTIMNHGAAADRLIAVTTPAAASAGLHATVMDGDVMRMEAVGALEISPGAMLELKPGGLHLMLTGLTSPLKEGQTIQLTLTFEKAGDVKVAVPIGGIAAGSHDHGSTGSGG